MHVRSHSKVEDHTFPFLSALGVFRNFNKAIVSYVPSSNGTRSKGSTDIIYQNILCFQSLSPCVSMLHSRSTKISNMWHMANGKGHHITACITDTSVLRTLQRGPTVSVIQKFHRISQDLRVGSCQKW